MRELQGRKTAGKLRQMDRSNNHQPDDKVTGTKGQKRRQQIIDAAKQALIEGGANSLVLRDVADQIGITHGNLQ